MIPRAIVFDFDGTIADTEWGVYVVVRDAFRAHGLDVTLESWVEIVGKAETGTLEEMLQEALGRPPDDDKITAAREAQAQVRSDTPMLPGVVEVIEVAVAAGLPLAVASSSPSGWVEHHLDRFRLRHHFEAVRGRDHVDRAKPDPDLFLAASAALGVDPGEVVAIEDSRHGCEAAKAAGMTCVVVPNRITRLDVHPEADWVIDSLLDFPFSHLGLPGPGG